MSRARVLLLAVVGGWLWAVVGSGPAHAQILAMPLTVAQEKPPEMQFAPAGAALQQEAVPPVTVDSLPSPVCGPFLGQERDNYFGGGCLRGQPGGQSDWSWQWFPRGRVYPAYLASGRESRFAGQSYHERNEGWLLDATIGGRAGLFRYGTDNPMRPEGYQLDFEAAAFPRVTLDAAREFVSSDFRWGLPLGLRRGPLEGKFGYYHYSSHLGDQFIESHAGAVSARYTRDALVLGLALRPFEVVRFYAEADYAFYINGNARPWQFQFGVDWSTLEPTSVAGAPFFAVNSMLRQDASFGGNFTVQAGWQWRGRSGELLRTGLHYFNGKSNQGQLFDRFEEQIGMGIWYDF